MLHVEAYSVGGDNMEISERERLVQVEDRAKSNTKRLDEHDEQIKELNNVYLALTKVDDKVTNVENDVSEIKSEIKKGKEQKRYEVG